VLLQHNFVRAYLQPEEAFVTGVRPAQHLYEPCTDWALQTLRCATSAHFAIPLRTISSILMALWFLRQQCALVPASTRRAAGASACQHAAGVGRARSRACERRGLGRDARSLIGLWGGVRGARLAAPGRPGVAPAWMAGQGAGRSLGPLTSHGLRRASGHLTASTDIFVTPRTTAPHTTVPRHPALHAPVPRARAPGARPSCSQ
jgi:hypothetical protein